MWWRASAAERLSTGKLSCAGRFGSDTGIPADWQDDDSVKLACARHHAAILADAILAVFCSKGCNFFSELQFLSQHRLAADLAFPLLLVRWEPSPIVNSHMCSFRVRGCPPST